MHSKPEVSIIVLGYNNLPYLEECLGAILAQKAPSFEVLYADNASTDASSEFVRSKFPSVKVVQNSANSGYAGGNNFGAKHASGEYLLFANPDTIAQDGWLSSLLDFAKKEKAARREAIACSKVLLAGSPGTVNSLGVFLSVLGFSGSMGDGEKSSSYSQPMPVFAPTGCSFIISRKLFLELGGFDESFFMYDEDLDLGWRAANMGAPSWMVPSSTILHKYKRFSGRAAPYFQTARNRLWAIRKNERGWRKFCLASACALFSLALSFGMLLRLKPGIARSILGGILAGLRTPIKPDKRAGGPAHDSLLGMGASLSVFASKFAKHFGPKKQD